MNTGFPGCRQASRLLSNIVAATLVAFVMGGCGGGGGGGPYAEVERPPVPADPVVYQPVCTDEQQAAKWKDLACPAGMICVADVLGQSAANIVPLTSGNRPDWAPTESRLAFHRIHSSHYLDGEVFVINVDGTGESMLAAGVQPAWSPGGEKIAFVNDEGIAVMNTDGTQVRTLLRHDFAPAPGFGVGTPAWSPDGQQIVFVHYIDDIPAKLYIMDSNGNDPRRLSVDVGNVRRAEIDPAWSPSGGKIAFMNFPDLATVDAAGGTPLSIFPGGEVVSKPDWFPDGTLIAFAQATKCGPYEIHTVDDSGESAQMLVAGAREPAWSPDGGRIAFASAAAAFPPVTSAASVYIRESPETAGWYSRYVLYESGRFELQYVVLDSGFYAYTGSYSRTAHQFSFRFDGGSSAHPWHATAALDGPRFTIYYNLAASMEGFEDGVYVFSETVPSPAA